MLVLLLECSVCNSCKRSGRVTRDSVEGGLPKVSYERVAVRASPQLEGEVLGVT